MQREARSKVCESASPSSSAGEVGHPARTRPFLRSIFWSDDQNLSCRAYGTPKGYNRGYSRLEVGLKVELAVRCVYVAAFLRRPGPIGMEPALK